MNKEKELVVNEWIEEYLKHSLFLDLEDRYHLRQGIRCYSIEEIIEDIERMRANRQIDK